MSLLSLFSEDLREQGAGTFADIREQKFDALLGVPYWSWMDHHEDVAAILAKDSATNEIRYAWPLLRDILRDCVCVVSGQSLEIAPQLAPLHLFGSYSGAAHRVFMSATVTNDAFLVKGLGLSADIITSPLVDKHEKWSGEKMILIPSLISPQLNREAMIASFAPASDKRKYGRVVLTPSFHLASEWGAAGAVVADKQTIYGLVEDLKSGIVDRTLVVANRYDGIDLPDRACRILILDSKPYSETLVDRWTENARIGSEVIATKVARTIEQGLGRSVRGEKDYSVIILTGPDLTMYPLLRPGSIVQIDENQTKPSQVKWKNEHDRPIYFIELRGEFICSWCEIGEGTLLAVPYPSPKSEIRRFAHPREAEVVGRVTSVAAMQLAGPQP
jgi:hypothetical protein